MAEAESREAEASEQQVEVNEISCHSLFLVVLYNVKINCIHLHIKCRSCTESSQPTHRCAANTGTLN